MRIVIVLNKPMTNLELKKLNYCRREGLAVVTLTVGGALSRSGMPTEMFARLL